jgi:predicted ATPase/DNA-binding CsgD family transcriptional regulator
VIVPTEVENGATMVSMTSERSASSTVTTREREVLSLLEAHLTNSQIADELCLSVRTVESHVSSLMRKLGVGDRRSLARSAIARGAAQAPADPWPAELSSFVGREVERDALLAALTEHRMVTVTGPGGVGKTRLAISVARDIAASRHGGGVFVDLVAVTDPGMVLAAVASAARVAEQPGGSLADAVIAALSGSDAILVLDNCEHLVDAARSTAEMLLSSCPSLQLVATSRVRLAAPFEWVYEVPGLSVTQDGGDSVRLFLERATAAGDGSGIDRRQVSALCRSLDGMPLAIELAAGRYPSLGVDGLLAGLQQRLRYLTSGSNAGDRHRSLRDAIAWSHQLLGDADRSLLETISVFASWFDVDAAATLVPDLTSPEVADGLGRLADHHLLVVTPGQPTRYRALETIRQFADEQLVDHDDADAAHDQHRQWCTAQLQSLAAEPHDDAWCARFDGVADDARAALRWAADRHQESAAALAEQLAEQLLLRGQLAEAQRRYEEAARHTSAGSERVRLLRLAAGVAAARVTGNDTLRLLDAAATEALSSGDRATAASCRAWMMIYVHMMPGIIAVLPSATEQARWLEQAQADAGGVPAVEAAVDVATASGLPESDVRSHDLAVRAVSLARRHGAPLVESVALDQLCAVHLARHNLGSAIEVLRRRGEVLDALPLDASTAYQFNDYLLMASEVHLAAGDLSLAAHYADRLAALACYREQAHLATSRRIKVDALAGDLDTAAERGEQFLAAWERAGRPLARTLNVTCYALAMVHGLRGDDQSRAQWSDVTRTLSGDPARLAGCATGWAPTFDALVALDRDEPGMALERLSADIDDRAIWGSWNAGLWRPWYAALWVEAAVLAGAPAAAERLRRGVSATRENPIAATMVGRAADLARGDHEAVRARATTFAELGCRYQQHRTLRLLRRLGGEQSR